MPSTKNKTSPALVPVADVAPDEEAQEMAARIEAVGEEIYVDLNLDPAELANAAARAINAASRNTAIAGLNLLALKAKSNHGDFMSHLESRDIHPRSAQRAMDIANFLLKLSNTTALSHLVKAAPTKLLALAKLNPTDLEQLAENNNTDLDGLLTMSSRDIEAEVRKYQRIIKGQQEDINELKEAAAEPGGVAAWKIKAEQAIIDINVAQETAREQIRKIVAARAALDPVPG